jgi:hypothetical protein
MVLSSSVIEIFCPETTPEKKKAERMKITPGRTLCSNVYIVKILFYGNLFLPSHQQWSWVQS